MEYCGSENVGQIINNRAISIHDAIDYAKQLCEGLHFLHSVNILHRDIKPENLMIDNGVCKLVDFGSTTNLGDNESFIRGSSIKTKNYTPPEYFENGRIYGRFSDIYQIGVVLHEMLNGRVKIDYSKLPRGFLKNYETQIGKPKDSFTDWDISVFENGIISHFSRKNSFLATFSEPKSHVPRKLIDTIKTITNCDYAKRPNSCVILRNLLSNLVVPNWLKISDEEYFVSNWKGKDYKITYNSKKNEWILEYATNNSTNYRKNSSVKTWDSVVKLING
jgi:serine/threonine protein kinase